MEENQLSNSEQTGQFQSSDLGGGLKSFPSPTGQTGDDVNDNKLWAILAYLLFFSVIILFVKKDSLFAKFHSKQGALLLGITSGFIISGSILSLFLGNFMGWLLLFYWVPGSILIFGFFIFGIMNAAAGQMKQLPIIGGLANLINI